MLWFLVVCLFVVKVQAEHISDDKVYEWNVDPYRRSTSLDLTCDEGYRILVKFTKCNINGGAGDYLLIKSGTSLDDPGSGRIFTYQLKNLDTNPRNYIIDSTAAMLRLVTVKRDNLDIFGVRLTYQRIGEDLVTTETPTTTISWPTAGPNVVKHFNVYVGTKSYNDFTQHSVRDSFRNGVAAMANDYCKSQNIILLEQATNTNVLIQDIRSCPLNWPNTDYCTSINFSLPVFINPEKGYQLEAGHIREMWTRLANAYLRPYGMSVFTVPDNEAATKWWIIISISALVLFIILLFIIRALVARKYATKKRKNSDTHKFYEKHRMSELSLGPDPLQSTPQLFDNVYDYFEPSTPSVRMNNSHHNAAFEADDLYRNSDDLDIDEANFQPSQKLNFTFEKEEYDM